MALIAGGASGTGEATARVFATQGCRVALIDISGEHLKRSQKKYVKVGGEVTLEEWNKTISENIVGVFFVVGKLSELWKNNPQGEGLLTLALPRLSLPRVRDTAHIEPQNME